MAGDLIAQDLQVGCHVKLVTPTSWLKNLQRNQEGISYDIIHKALVYGFEISWLNVPCKNLQCGNNDLCSFDAATDKLECLCYSIWGGNGMRRPCGITQIHFASKKIRIYFILLML
jgi:hypothetical protein